MQYDSSRAIFEEIARVTPSYGGITYERIEAEGLHWPCPTPDHPGTPILHGQQFTRGKGKFHAIEWIPPAEQVDDEYPLYLTTGRVLYQYHTGTMTMKTDGLNDRAPRSFVEMSHRDADRYGVQDGDQVTIASRRGKIQVEVRIQDKAVEGTVFIPFHYAKGAVNILTNAALDPVRHPRTEGVRRQDRQSRLTKQAPTQLPRAAPNGAASLSLESLPVCKKP